jgi:hypothetical protein
MYADGRNYINDELHEYETLNPENSVMKELYTACYKGIRAAYAIKHYAADAVIRHYHMKNSLNLREIRCLR